MFALKSPQNLAGVLLFDMCPHNLCIASSRGLLFALLVVACTLATVRRSDAQSCASSTAPNVLTAQYDNQRDGYNSQETVLTSSCLQKAPTRAVEPKLPLWSPLIVEPPPAGFTTNGILAQPLYYPAISTSLTNCNPSCNMLIVATLSGSVYAFNAGDTTSSGGTVGGAVVWSRSGTSSLVYDCGPNSVTGSIGKESFAGIVGTPPRRSESAPTNLWGDAEMGCSGYSIAVALTRTWGTHSTVKRRMSLL